nr:uncharacterized protein I203_07547 [Kwoniella mangroviensis CBS 8507]OCF63474.1 hypothetical protein I203_07547 [Kwoniella mangroviensis CBS 8507]
MAQIDDQGNQPQQGVPDLVEQLLVLADKNNGQAELLPVLDQLAVVLRDASTRVPLGQTDLPQILVGLLKSQDEQVLRQVGRVAANLVIGCDENRERLIVVGYIDSVLSTRAFDSQSQPEPESSTLSLTASIHNLVVEKHAAVISALKQDLPLRTLLEFARRWTNIFYELDPLDPTVTIIRWTWSILSIVLEEPPSSLDASTFDIFILPFSSTSSDIDTHLHIITSASDILEAILAPEGPVHQQILPHLDVLLEFVEKAEVPEEAKEETQDEDEGSDEDETPDRTKSLASAKAAIIRVLVGLSSEIPSASPFWQRMRSWLSMKDRSDLVNCALLSSGNSIKDACSARSLLEGDSSLLPVILPLLSPFTPATTQHAVIGLVRNLSVPIETKTILGEAGVVERLAEMQVWSQEKDLLGSVQGGAAVILKNLCRNDVKNSHRFLAQPLDPLLDLIKRAEDPALTFECTRLLVNIIKSLSLAKEPLNPVADQRIVDALVRMLVDGAQYMILQSESVIALTLLATFGGGQMRTIVSASLEGPGVQAVQTLAENPRREIKENAQALLDFIDR